MAKTFDELADRTMTPKARVRAARRTREILLEMLLGEVRRCAGKSQSQLAAALGIKQPTLSKLENQGDMQISTLKRIIEALGGELEIIARFPKHSVRLGQFQDKPNESAAKATAPKRRCEVNADLQELQLF